MSGATLERGPDRRAQGLGADHPRPARAVVGRRGRGRARQGGLRERRVGCSTCHSGAEAHEQHDDGRRARAERSRCRRSSASDGGPRSCTTGAPRRSPIASGPAPPPRTGASARSRRRTSPTSRRTSSRCKRGAASAAGAAEGAAPPRHHRRAPQPVEHRRDAIEERVARPRCRARRRSPRRPRRAGWLRDSLLEPAAVENRAMSVTALAAVALGDVERDGAERGSELLAEIAIVLAGCARRRAEAPRWRGSRARAPETEV